MRCRAASASKRRLSTKRERDPLPPCKRMDEGARRWMIQMTVKNAWRVNRYFDIDDLIQEGYLCWAITTSRYQPKNAAHQMALFKSILTNRLHDLAKKQTRGTIEVPFSLFSDEQFHKVVNSVPCELAPLLAKIAEAKTPLNLIIKTILLDKRFDNPHQHGDMHRETTHEKLCRLLNLDPHSINLHKLLSNYLQTS